MGPNTPMQQTPLLGAFLARSPPPPYQHHGLALLIFVPRAQPFLPAAQPASRGPPHQKPRLYGHAKAVKHQKPSHALADGRVAFDASLSEMLKPGETQLPIRETQIRSSPIPSPIPSTIAARGCCNTRQDKTRQDKTTRP